MNTPNSSLYIYPEGELVPVSEALPEFKKGLAWLFQNMNEDIDFVPIAFYSHTFRSSKPELYINVGRPVILEKSLSKEQLTAEFEKEVHYLLKKTREVAGFSDVGFEKQ